MMRMMLAILAGFACSFASAEQSWFNFNTSGEGVFSGEQWRMSGWQPGYVVLVSGARLDGRIRLREVNGQLAQIHVQAVDGKGKKKKLEFPIASLDTYGPHVTIAHLTKNGKKLRKKQAENFHQGEILWTAGGRQPGMVAVRGSTVLFTPSVDGHVRILEPSDVSEATQHIDGGATEWLASGDRYILRPDARDVSTTSGRVLFADGREASGQVSIVYGDWYGTAVNFVGTDNRVRKIPADVVAIVSTTASDGDVSQHVNYGGVLTRVLQDGPRFMLFRNPFPTTENKLLSGLANTAVAIGTTAVAVAAATAAADKAVEQEFEQSMKRTNNVAVASQQATAAGAAAQYNVLNQFQPPEDASAFKFMKTEYAIYDKTKGRVLSFHKGDVDEKTRGLLMGCMDFVMMDKSDQKRLVDFDRLDGVVKFLNRCYKS